MRNVNVRGRGAYNHRQNEANNLKKIIAIIAIMVVALFVVMKIFGNSESSTQNQGASLHITPLDAKSSIYVSNQKGNKTMITSSGSLYANGDLLVVDDGGAKAILGASSFDFARNSEILYEAKVNADTNTTTDTIDIQKGSAWAQSASDNLVIKLKNLSAKLPSGSIAMFEQTNTVFSSVYAIRGNVQIITSVGQYTLTPGKKISLSGGEATNASTNLSEKVNDFDSSVASMEIFIRNDGETLLKESQQENKESEQTGTETATGATASGATSATSGKYIAFTQPVDGSTIKTTTTTVTGRLLSTDVARVTLDDKDTVVSPVNETFSMENFALQNGINNIVYKVYSPNGVELERGVLVVHGSVKNTVTTIVPENFPNLKDFVIVAPAQNPFATTEDYVRVQGKIPANTVKYITVNGYRLQKFVANSTTWYYHANAAINTMKEGTNLYYINFYDNNDRLIHTQIFTIIKDSKNARSTQTTTEASPLFPAQ